MNTLEMFATALCSLSIIGYISAAILFIKKKEKLAYILAVSGWIFNLGIFIKNWYINGYPPFASMYQVLSDLSLTFVVVMIVIILRQSEMDWIAPYFCFGAAIPLIGTLFMDRNMRWSLVPALRSEWFVPHVFSYMLSYALCTVAFLICLEMMIRGKERKKLEIGIYLILRTAFPFMVLGLLLGAIWADQVWGNYWNWDIKEVWALITCTFYLCYFHVRRSPTLQKSTVIFAILGFAALVITFMCVNIFPNQAGSLHTYNS